VTVDYAQAAVLRTLVGYRNRLTDGVDALDRAIEIIQEFGHINPAHLQPAATAATETPKVLAGRKPGDKWIGGRVQCRWCPKDFRAPGHARTHERLTHPDEFSANATQWMTPVAETPPEPPQAPQAPQGDRHPCTRPGCGETFDTGMKLGGHMNHHKAEDRQAAWDKQAADTQMRTTEAARQRQEENRARTAGAAARRADDADRRLQHTLPEPAAPPTGRRLDITAPAAGLIPTGLARRPPDTDRLRRQAYEDINDEVAAG
jgi:hypothetical protein